MPSILTHQYFSTLIVEQVSKEFPYLQDHLPVVWLGAQGPDPFFFFGRAPFKKRLGRDSIIQFGSLLHNQSPVDSLAPLIEHGWRGPHATEMTKAYVIGALTHYALDRQCHPYVFYRSGFDEHGALTGHYSADHAKLEVEIDLAMTIKEKLSSAIYQPKVTLQIDPVSLQTISQIYYQAFGKHVHPDTFQHAVNDMKATYQFLYHGSWLNRLLVILLSGKRSLPFSLIHPHRIKQSVANQALNVSRKKWHHPVTGVPLTLTIPQLIDQSKEAMMDMLMKLKQKTWKDSILEAWCNNTDYDGKKTGSIFQYFSSYYPSYRGLSHERLNLPKIKKKSV